MSQANLKDILESHSIDKSFYLDESDGSIRPEFNIMVQRKALIEIPEDDSSIHIEDLGFRLDHTSSLSFIMAAECGEIDPATLSNLIDEDLPNCNSCCDRECC